MNHVTLGKSGLEVSPICIGAWQLGGPLWFDGKPDGHPDPGKKSVIAMIRELADLGINFIDTAEQYSAGESERRVGEAISGNRDHWIVSTKFGYRVAADGSREDDSSPATIMPSLEGSLKRLDTDRIDIYLYHCEPKPDELDAAREVLERAKANGKIRFYGISSGNTRLIETMAHQGMADVVQFPHSLIQPNFKMLELARQFSIGTQVRGVMAGGRLSGKYLKRTPDWHQDDNRSNLPDSEDFRRFAPLADALPQGYSLAQAAIRWVLDQPDVHAICLGAKSIDDYRSAIAALDLPPMEESRKATLQEAASRLG